MIAPDLLAALRPARVLLVGRRGGISDVIRAVTRSDFSHVALVDVTRSGVWVVLEATTDVKGVAARRLEVITDDPTVETLALYDLNHDAGLADYQRDLITRAAWLQTGEDYSQQVNLDILFGRAVEDWQTRHAVNCALCVGRAWAAIGLELINLEVPTPQAFVESALLRRVWSR